MAVHLPFILAVYAPLHRGCIHLWARYREVRRVRHPEQKIANGVAGERTAEGEAAEVVGRQVVHQAAETLSAGIHSESHRVLTQNLSQIVGELDVPRSR